MLTADRVQVPSISRPIWERIQGRPFVGRVLAVFERACNLVTSDGDVVALVLPEIGDGPLNVVVKASPESLSLLRPGLAAQLVCSGLQVGRLSAPFVGARIWEPCPDWVQLRAHRETNAIHHSLLRDIALRHGPTESLIQILPWYPNAPHAAPVAALDLQSRAGSILFRACEGAEALRTGWAGEMEQARVGAGRLAGLGSGLTPAGDDFLAGVMLWAWLAHPEPGLFCETLLDAAGPRTTTLSAAFLRAAAGGECSAAWHYLLTALSCGAEDELEAAVKGVLAHGHTSGADMLAGFLWLGL